MSTPTSTGVVSKIMAWSIETSAACAACPGATGGCLPAAGKPGVTDQSRVSPLVSSVAAGGHRCAAGDATGDRPGRHGHPAVSRSPDLLSATSDPGLTLLSSGAAY